MSFSNSQAISYHNTPSAAAVDNTSAVADNTRQAEERHKDPVGDIGLAADIDLEGGIARSLEGRCRIVRDTRDSLEEDRRVVSAIPRQRLIICLRYEYVRTYAIVARLEVGYELVFGLFAACDR